MWLLIASFAAMGTIFVGFEINALFGGQLGADSLGFGLFLGIFWAVVYHYFHKWWWLNLLMLVFLFYALLGTVLGLLQIFSFAAAGARSSVEIPVSGVASIVLFIINTLASILGIIQFFREVTRKQP